MKGGNKSLVGAEARKVLFPDGTSEAPEVEVIVGTNISNSSMMIKLGILKCYHKYHVNVSWPKEWKLPDKNEPIEWTQTDSIKFLAANNSDIGLLMLFEVVVLDVDSLEQETVCFLGNDLQLIFTGSVLGPHKGTPLLKHGIKRISKIAMPVDD